MGPIPKSLGTVVLVGCFIMGVAVAGERKVECDDPYKGHPETVLRDHQEWLESQGGQKANLCGADLQRLCLDRANVYQADLGGVDLRGAIYEPIPHKLPDYWTLAHPRNRLDTLVFQYSPAALMALRKAFIEGGMRTQERQITYAIERARQRQPSWLERAWGQIKSIFRLIGFENKGDEPSWLERAWDQIESEVRFIAFDLPSGYGMAPRRALTA